LKIESSNFLTLGFANPAYPPPQYGAPGPAVDPYAAPQAGVPAYAQPPPAPQSLAPSPQPVIINIQQNASSQNLAPAPPQAPIGNAFGHENVYCKCPFCGHQVIYWSLHPKGLNTPNSGNDNDGQKSRESHMDGVLDNLFRHTSMLLSSFLHPFIYGHVSLLRNVQTASRIEDIII
jgi:hypothetical protein